MIQTLGITFSSVILMWFGYSLFFGPMSPLYNRNLLRKTGRRAHCPVCSQELYEGEELRSMVFPSFSGQGDKLVYIRGCESCLIQRAPRKCPFCGSRLSVRDFLVSKIFEHSDRPHTHVIGCNHCKPSLSKRALC